MTGIFHRPRRILTWHVHGNYLYYLSQMRHELYLVTDEERSPGHSGRSGVLPWGWNVHEARVEDIRDMEFDLVLYQSRSAWEAERHELLSPAQQRLPCIYIEHDPPLTHPTECRHWVDDPSCVLVHVTPFNALMWDSGRCPVRVIEHGVKLVTQSWYHGDIARGLVVINDIGTRGRRVGLDLYQQAAAAVPMELVGMNSLALGGAGEVPQDQLPACMAAHRFFFHPARYTSLGLAIIEAMMIGAPVVGLATTELSTVIRDGENGLIDTRPERLIDGMRHLLDHKATARQLGEAGRKTALERFNIERFTHDWERLVREVCG
ncbi:glycosyltransferase family 4 protein [Variovorax soli]|jgi:hypothetical protein|uniref:glycosyltransferase family 4 protein n=1 Tax=Variovorax soli TaxID=376815 RepID=UPI000838DD9D|nr:glycosyltransferase family 4 protein [Variovorax soli]